MRLAVRLQFDFVLLVMTGSHSRFVFKLLNKQVWYKMGVVVPKKCRPELIIANIWLSSKG